MAKRQKKMKITGNVLIEKMMEVNDRLLKMRRDIRRYAVKSYVAYQHKEYPNVVWMEANKCSFRIVVSKLDENGQKQYDISKSGKPGNEKIDDARVTKNTNISDLPIFELVEQMISLQELGLSQK